MSPPSHSRFLIVTPLLLLLASVFGQSPLDLSVHFTPHLRYVNAKSNSLTPAPGSTSGQGGIGLGYDVGATIGYRVTGEIYIRTGLDYVHKRHSYGVERLGNDVQANASTTNLVTYRALEVPVQLLYRFGYDNGLSNYLVGIGVVAARFIGDPRIRADLSNKDLTGFESVVTEGTPVSIFVGYDRFISRRLILSLEPYLLLTPDRINLETNTTANVVAEGGIRIRLTRDN